MASRGHSQGTGPEQAHRAGGGAFPREAHLLLQTNPELLCGQRRPRRRRLGCRERLAPVQAPKVLVVPADTGKPTLRPWPGAGVGGRSPRLQGQTSPPQGHGHMAVMCARAHTHTRGHMLVSTHACIHAHPVLVVLQCHASSHERPDRWSRPTVVSLSSSPWLGWSHPRQPGAWCSQG